jgi:hypothetical protein
MTEFKQGDIVRMKVGDEYIHGEVTIIRDDKCKVMWREPWAPDYWYYPAKDLELVERKNAT